MSDIFHPDVISLVALLAGLIIGWLVRDYTIKLPEYDESSDDCPKQSWDGMRDAKGRFVRII